MKLKTMQQALGCQPSSKYDSLQTFIENVLKVPRELLNKGSNMITQKNISEKL